MPQLLYFVGTYAIPVNRLEEFKQANIAMGDFVRANEPQDPQLAHLFER